MKRQPKQIKLSYIPTEKQKLFHTSQANELFYGGAAGGGKSGSCVVEAGLLCLEHPNIETYLFRRTYPELEMSLIREAHKWWYGIGKYSQARHEWSFPNGSKMLFRHCQHDRDRFLYQGAEINALFIDELTHFSQQVVDYLQSRVRAEKTLNFKPRARYTGNPGGVGHAWVKQKYADLEPYKLHEIIIKSSVLNKTKTVTRQYIPARVTDNPHLTEDYVFELEQRTPALRKALLDGDWNTFEGQVFFEWRDDPEHYRDGKFSHVIEPFEIPSSWTRYRSYDWGYTKPFSVLWWAVDEDGRAYLYREWYGASAADVGIKMPVEQQAKRIKELEQYDGNIIGYADPAIWNASMGESVAEQMMRKKVYFNPGDNNRMAGKAEFHNRLSFDENGVPMLYVFNSCTEFRRTFPALVYSDIRVEDVDTSGEDHAYDAARYFLMSRPLAAKRVNGLDRYDTTPDYSDQVKNFHNYGR